MLRSLAESWRVRRVTNPTRVFRSPGAMCQDAAVLTESPLVMAYSLKGEADHKHTPPCDL